MEVEGEATTDAMGKEVARQGDEVAPSAPSAPKGGIRPYRPSDLASVRELVASGVMEMSRRSNAMAFRHPLTLSLALGLASGLHWSMGWGERHFWRHWQWTVVTAMGYVASLATVSVVLMIAIEYYHLTMFSGEVRRVLASDDLLAIEAYYGGDKGDKDGSGMWVCEYDDKVIGCIALDAKQPQLKHLRSIDDKVFQDRKAGRATGGPVENGHGQQEPSPLRGHATIRRFIVSRRFRRFHLGSDLLSHALRQGAQAGIRLVRAPCSSLQPEARAMLERMGFRGPATMHEARLQATANDGLGPGEGWEAAWRPRKVGLFGVELGWKELDVLEWQREEDAQ